MSLGTTPRSRRLRSVRSSSSHWPNAVPSSNGTHRLGSATKHSKAAPAQVELGDHELVEQADDVRARAHDEALVGERALERAGAAQALAALEHEHRAAGAREVGRRGQAVVAAADDDRVPVARGELGQRRGEADLAELGCDLVHAAIRPRGAGAGACGGCVGAGPDERVDGDGAARVDDHGVELEQLEALRRAAARPRARRARRRPRRRPARRCGCRPAAARRAASAAPARRAPASAGSGMTATSPKRLGPDAAEADDEHGDDRVAARADQQLDARRRHRLDEHARAGVTVVVAPRTRSR